MASDTLCLQISLCVGGKRLWLVVHCRSGPFGDDYNNIILYLKSISYKILIIVTGLLGKNGHGEE